MFCKFRIGILLVYATVSFRVGLLFFSGSFSLLSCSWPNCVISSAISFSGALDAPAYFSATLKEPGPREDIFINSRWGW